MDRRNLGQAMSTFLSTKTYGSNLQQVSSGEWNRFVWNFPKRRKVSNHYREINPKIFEFFLPGILVSFDFAPGMCQKSRFNGFYLGNSTFLGFSRDFPKKFP